MDTLIEAQNSLLPMAAFALATSASPGPVNIVLAMSGSRFGVRNTVPYAVGATASFVAILITVGSGLGLFMTNSPFLAKTMAVIGALYMLYIAHGIFRASVESMSTETLSASPPNFLSGVIAQTVNPKAWTVSLSATSIFTTKGDDYAFLLSSLVSIYLVVCFFSLVSWSMLGALLYGNFKRVRLFNTAMSILLTVSVIFFVANIFMA